jgi:oligopeptide transport system ATP-binding protein
MTVSEREAVLDVAGLEMEFRVGRGLFRARDVLRAVDGVSLSIARGETLALVGESGSGKTTVGRCIVRLLEPTGGSVTLLGRDISRLSRSAVRPLRRHMHIVFQDPYSSLNPRMTIGQIVGGPLANHGIVRRRDRRTRVAQMLERVGLRQELQDRYPHSLSGGQRQRVAIARALIAGPTLLVADEPISALDASVQASMLNLLVDLQREMRFACLFITHDLSAAQFLADRIAVMYLGQIVESGTRAEIFAAPRHPYTQSLLSAVLVPDPAVQRSRDRFVLAGDPPSPLDPPSGCRFHPRCPIAIERCVTEPPLLVDPSGGLHDASCHLVGPNGEPPVLPGLGRHTA